MRHHKRTDKKKTPNKICTPKPVRQPVRRKWTKWPNRETRLNERVNNMERTDHKGENRRENRMSLQKIMNHNSAQRTQCIVFITFARSLFRIVAVFFVVFVLPSFVLSLSRPHRLHTLLSRFRWNFTLQQRTVGLQPNEMIITKNKNSVCKLIPHMESRPAKV